MGTRTIYIPNDREKELDEALRAIRRPNEGAGSAMLRATLELAARYEENGDKVPLELCIAIASIYIQRAQGLLQDERKQKEVEEDASAD